MLTMNIYMPYLVRRPWHHRSRTTRSRLTLISFEVYSTMSDRYENATLSGLPMQITTDVTAMKGGDLEALQRVLPTNSSFAYSFDDASRPDSLSSMKSNSAACIYAISSLFATTERRPSGGIELIYDRVTNDLIRQRDLRVGLEIVSRVQFRYTSLRKTLIQPFIIEQSRLYVDGDIKELIGGIFKIPWQDAGLAFGLRLMENA